jgi:hypothetical protein
MSAFVKGFLSNMGAGDYARDQQAARTARQKQIQLLDEKAQLERDATVSAQVYNVANELGITGRGGETIDEAKLATKLEEGRKNGQLNPRLSDLLVMMGNEDLGVKKNPGFKFKSLSVGPNGTFTLQGGYEGEEGNRYLTQDGKQGDDAPVALMSVNDVAQHAATQYNKVRNRKGAALDTREQKYKNRYIDENSSIRGNEQLIIQTVGSLTNDLETALFNIYPRDKATAMSRGLQEDLKGKSYSERLAILQEVGSKLSIPNEELSIPPEQVEAAAKAAAETTSPTTETENPLVQRQLVTAQKNLEAAQKSGDESYIKRAQARVDELTAKQGQPVEQARLTKSQRKAAEKQLATAQKGLNTAKKSGDESYIKRAQARVDKLNAKLGKDDTDTKIKDPDLKEASEKIQGATEQDFIEGRVQLTEKDLVALRKKLEADGIKSLEQANKASRENLLYIKAALSTVAKDQTQRQEYMQRINNMIDTGMPGYSKKDYDSASSTQYSNETTRANNQFTRDKFFEEVSSSSNTAIQDSLSDLGEVIFDKNGEIKDYDMDSIDAIFSAPGKGFTKTWNQLKQQMGLAKRNPNNSVAREKTQMLRQGLFEQLSLYVQLYNKSDDPEVSFLATDEDSPVVATDSSMSKLHIAERDQETGNPTVFHVLKSDGRTQSGDAMTASQLRKKFGSAELYDFFVDNLEQFQANRPK